MLPVVWPHDPGDLDGRQGLHCGTQHAGGELKESTGVWQAWGLLPIYFIFLKILNMVLIVFIVK